MHIRPISAHRQTKMSTPNAYIVSLDEMATSGTFGGTGSTADELPLITQKKEDGHSPLLFSFSRQTQEVPPFTLFDTRKPLGHLRYGSYDINRQQKSTSFLESRKYEVSDSLDGGNINEFKMKLKADKLDVQAIPFRNIQISPQTTTTTTQNLRQQFFYPKAVDYQRPKPQNQQGILYPKYCGQRKQPKDQIVHLLTQIQSHQQNNGRYAVYATPFNRKAMPRLY